MLTKICRSFHLPPKHQTETEHRMILASQREVKRNYSYITLARRTGITCPRIETTLITGNRKRGITAWQPQ